MADLSTLARPYAKAAFDYASEHNKITDWEEFLLFSSHVVRDDAFEQLLHNPAISVEQKVSALVDMYDSQSALDASESVLHKLLNKLTGTMNKVSPELRNFVTQLADNNRLALIPQIYTHFCQHKSEALKQVDAYVTSAYPLTDVQRVLIQSRLAASMNATVVLHESVDESLLAGATIKVGDKIVDDSVRGKLKQLKTQLTA